MLGPFIVIFHSDEVAIKVKPYSTSSLPLSQVDNDA